MPAQDPGHRARDRGGAVPGPQNIAGPPTVCAGTAGVNYSTDTIAGYLHLNVVGGNLVGGNGTPGSSWTGPTRAAPDRCRRYRPAGLHGRTLGAERDRGTRSPGRCGGLTPLIGSGTVQLGGSPTGPPSTFQWNPANGLSNANSATPTATTDHHHLCGTGEQWWLQWPRTPSSSAGRKRSAEAGDDDAICMGDTIPSMDRAGTYQWSPAFELSDAGMRRATGLPSPDHLHPAGDRQRQVHGTGQRVDRGSSPCPRWMPAPTPRLVQAVSSNSAEPPQVLRGRLFLVPITGSTPRTARTLRHLVHLPELGGAGDRQQWLCVDGQRDRHRASGTALDAGADTPDAPRDSVQLQATGAGTFIWSPASGLSDPSLPPPGLPSQTTLCGAVG